MNAGEIECDFLLVTKGRKSAAISKTNRVWGSNKIFIEKTRNSHNPNHGYFIKVISKSNHLVGYSDHGTTHGSPLYYDTHVPLIFLGNNIESKHQNDSAYTIDIAPTLIDYIGIKDYFLFDGKRLNLDKK